MAKRRKRSRVGNVNEELMTIGGLMAGAFVGNLAKSFVPASVNSTLVEIGEVGAGVGVATYSKNAFIKNMGRGMSVDGGTTLLSDVMGKAKATTKGIAGATLNRRANGIGNSYPNGKVNTDTSFEIV